MANMRVDLRGLLLRAANQIEKPERALRGYYAFRLREVAEHLEQVRKGEATFAEFADLYSLTERKKP